TTPHRKRLPGCHQMPDTATPVAPRPDYWRRRLLATAKRRAPQRHFGCGRPKKSQFHPCAFGYVAWADAITDNTDSQDVSSLSIMQRLTQISTKLRTRRQIG